MLPGDITEDLTKRLKSTRGQIDGLLKMIEEEKDPEQISIQFKAADQGLQKAHFILLDEVFRKSLAIKLVKVMNSCPGNCPDADKIELLQKEFPNLGNDEITNKLKEISAIGERLNKYIKTTPEKK